MLSRLTKLFPILIFIIISFIYSPFIFAAQNQLQDIHIATAVDNNSPTRLSLSFNNTVSYKVFTLQNPQRLVIDIKNCHAQIKANQVAVAANSPVNHLRFGIQNGMDLRVVFDLNQSINPNAFTMPSLSGGGEQLIVDCSASGQQSAAAASSQNIAAPTDLNGNSTLALNNQVNLAKENTSANANNNFADNKYTANNNSETYAQENSPGESESAINNGNQNIAQQNNSAGNLSNSDQDNTAYSQTNYINDDSLVAQAEANAHASKKVSENSVAESTPQDAQISNPISPENSNSFEDATNTYIPSFGKGNRPVIVVIDAGHGGKDPGASGPLGIHEKNVTLAIANDLKYLVDKQPGMHAVMTRDGDYYVGLRDRLMIARKDKGDIFIAIHADAAPAISGDEATGASVYALSLHGASSEAARWVAEKENYSELGGIDLDNIPDQDNMLRSVLIDLSQTATISDSLILGHSVLRQLSILSPLHHDVVEQAPFMVLKSPDIPSILVETGFITNPREENRLSSPVYQEELAQAMLMGIKSYFVHYAPPGTWLANNKRNEDSAVG